MKKILAVDDDQDILYTIAAIGNMVGWSVATTDRPHEALNFLKRTEYDSIIVDYHMPEMDGLVLVRAMREVNKKVPIIVLTVDDRMILAERFQRAGANDFAVKPIKASDFVSRINVHLALHRRKPLESPKSIISIWEEDPSSLPKGLSIPTLSLIISLLEEEKRHEESWLTGHQIATCLGIAYQTVWRYMDVLESEDVVDVRFDYGNRGRSKKKYRLKGSVTSYREHKSTMI